jgi:hypothetical protein
MNISKSTLLSPVTFDHIIDAEISLSRIVRAANMYSGIFSIIRLAMNITM